MRFHVYRCQRDKDCFVVTDADHEGSLDPKICPTHNDALEKVGVFPEMGEERAAFDEGLAKRSIEHQGFYRFHSTAYDPVAQPPASMP